jgi:hypothetical protein
LHEGHACLSLLASTSFARSIGNIGPAQANNFRTIPQFQPLTGPQRQRQMRKLYGLSMAGPKAKMPFRQICWTAQRWWFCT